MVDHVNISKLDSLDDGLRGCHVEWSWSGRTYSAGACLLHEILAGAVLHCVYAARSDASLADTLANPAAIHNYAQCYA